MDAVIFVHYPLSERLNPAPEVSYGSLTMIPPPAMFGTDPPVALAPPRRCHPSPTALISLFPFQWAIQGGTVLTFLTNP